MQQNRPSLSPLLVTLALLLALLTCVFFYIYRTHEENTRRAYQWLSEGAFYQSQIILTRFDGMFSSLASYAQAVSQQDFTREEKLNAMRAIRMACNFDFVVLLDSEGRGMNHRGDENIDLSQRRYFKEARQGRRSVDYVRSGAVAKDTSFVGMAVPVLREGHFIGAVYASYGVHYVEQLLSGQVDASRNYTKVVDGKGEELFSTHKGENVALDDMLSQRLKDIHSSGSCVNHDPVGAGAFKLEYDGQIYYVTHAPLRIFGNDWHIVNVLNKDATDVAESAVDMYAIGLILQLIAISVVFFFFVYRRERLQSELDSVRLRAESASKAKSEFLARMSHEIRTPMNAIVHMARRGLEEKDNGRINGYLSKIDSASRILLHLINDVLDLAALEGHKVTLLNEPFHFPLLLRSWCSLYYDRCREKGLRFNLIVSCFGPEHLCGDAQRINQVVLHLLSNAVKYTPTGGVVTFEVKCRQRPEGKVLLSLTVSDTGCGMSEEALENLFAPYAQGQSLNASQSDSTGLGLAIARELVALMGGSITASSDLGQGSTFVVELPLHSVATEPLPLLLPWQGRTVLFYSQQDAMRHSLPKVIEQLGLRCVVVDSRTSMVAKLEEMARGGDRASLTIVDGIPVPMRKVEFLRGLIARFAPQLGMTVLVPHDISEVESEARSAGIDHVLPKPLYTSVLHALLAAHPPADVSRGGRSGREKRGEKAAKTVAAASNGLQGKRVLLVEDNDLNTDIATEILSSFGMQVACALNGREALEKILRSENEVYDLVLTDIQMPIMDGYALVAAIRCSEIERVAHMPVVAISANALSCDVEHSLASGMNAHVAKPIDVQHLREVLEKILARPA